MAIKKENPGLSDYELARQQKIAQNQALLNQLQLSAAQTGIAPKAKPRPVAAAGQKRKKQAATQRVKAEEDAGPRRTSARLQGIVADSEVARQKEEKQAEAFQEQQRVKRQRVSEDINLYDAVVNGKGRGMWNRAGMDWLSAVGPAQPGVRSFDPKRERGDTNGSDKEVAALRERLGKLELWEGVEPNRIKITPERIYSLGFHPTEEKGIVFAGDKLGNLGLFDSSQTLSVDDDEDNEAEPAITTFKIHTRTISTIHFPPTNSSNSTSLLTASYDSSIRRLDLQQGTAVEVYAPTDKSADEPLSGVEISSTDPNLLHFTTLNGGFGIHDLRTPQGETVSMFQLSEKKIGGFSLYPSQPHFVATASLDRTLKLWDLRSIKGKGENRHPLLVGEHESRLSVSHAAFNSAGQIATASYDDTIKIHSLPSSLTSPPSSKPTPQEVDLTPTTIIPHNNQTGRWVTILRAQWQLHPRGPSAASGGKPGIQRFVIGNMNRFVDIYTDKGQQVAQLGGEGITAVPAVCQMHPTREWVGGGTGSGKLCLWM